MPKKMIKPYQPAMGNKRVEKKITKTIKASPQKIFPLACPVEELKWIPEWEYDLIYSKSGVNETHCIFNEYKSGLLFFDKPIATTWVTALHDPENHCILFELNLSQKAVIQLNFKCEQIEDNLSTCTWHMVFTAIDQEANSITKDQIGEKLEFIMTFLSEALKQYCETGKILA